MSEAAGINTTPPRQPEESQPLSSSRARSLPDPEKVLESVLAMLAEARRSKRDCLRSRSIFWARFHAGEEAVLEKVLAILKGTNDEGPEGIAQADPRRKEDHE